MEWISVEEKQPEDENLKVVRYSDFYKGKNRGHIGITLSRFSVYYGSKDPTWDLDHSSQPIRVTHWADIPSEDTAL